MAKYDHLTKDELARLLEARDRRDATRFGLVWEANEIERDKAINSDFVALDLVAEQSVGAAPWRNLVIEGDNFDALRYLRMTYAGRVKCILIDPPYNRGKTDFVYNDRFIDENDAWRFSTWLEFLYQRLVIARDLLREDGVLLCCINDDNRAKLELLLDKVMPGMRIGSMAWRTRDSTSAKGRNFSDTHEHILIYGRSKFSFRGREKSQKKYKNPDNDSRGAWNIDPLTLAFDRIERKNLFYPIQNPKTGNWYPCDSNRVWAYASEKNPETKIDALESETMEEWIRQDKIVFPDPKEERVVVWKTLEELYAAIDTGDVPVTPKKKNLLLSKDTPNLEFWVGKRVGFGRPGFKKHWKDLRSHVNPVGSWIARLSEDVEEDDYVLLRSREAGEGTGVIEKVFGKKVFSYPKPPSLMQQLVAQSSEGNDIVLDFFGGSGTTAHAVLQQNTEDEDDRRFIIVSNSEATIDEPEKNICRDVCAPRIKAVINGFGGNSPTGGNFAYLQCRRIAPGRLVEIEHAQVWTALQMIHRKTLESVTDKEFLWAGDEETALAYVPRFTKVMVPALRKAVNSSAAVVLYSWQPETLRQYIRAGHVQHEAIPESLARRFGMKG
ncbi:site-specific DNA-methyltransferase [Nitrospira lenta]|uniref:site-specific DNA-methyltransferase (adenine-specific) n=1 Tax=Nitrospira lenta TaxID=1436998 RepID=A0A330LA92_9BACT|nr:site-specific DNA-methyltransferase [Nitrospira lenta]SPP66631.1 DNA methylase N-4/N-6 domain-containing protein [Nitrospira lenta]